MSARKKKRLQDANNLLEAVGSGLFTRNKNKDLVSLDRDTYRNRDGERDGDDGEQQPLDQDQDDMDLVFSFTSFSPPAVAPPKPPAGGLDGYLEGSSDEDEDNSDSDGDSIEDFEQKKQRVAARRKASETKEATSKVTTWVH